MDFTVGVEEEYQLVDPRTGGLRSRARDVLALDWSEEFRQELQQTTLEIGTRVCGGAAELTAELARLRVQAAAAAHAEDLAIVACGTHPFSRWEGQLLMDEERYLRIEEHYGRIARDEHNFGMHIHVAVPERVDRIQALNRVRRYGPLLVALACSSPFYEGEDTRFGSFRMVLWRRWPHSGTPPRFADRAEYRRYVDLLLRSRAIADEKNLYWSIRPHPTYPTLEFRMTDVCPRLDDAVAIAALARSLVVAAVEGRLDDESAPGLTDSADRALIDANEWRCARFGLDAIVTDPAAPGGSTHFRDEIRRLLDQVGPTAEQLGDDAALAHVDVILERGNGADRMRRVAAEEGGLVPLVQWLVGETMVGAGLDRRRAQRAPA